MYIGISACGMRGVVKDFTHTMKIKCKECLKVDTSERHLNFDVSLKFIGNKKLHLGMVRTPSMTLRDLEHLKGRITGSFLTGTELANINEILDSAITQITEEVEAAAAEAKEVEKSKK